MNNNLNKAINALCLFLFFILISFPVSLNHHVRIHTAFSYRSPWDVTFEEFQASPERFIYFHLFVSPEFPTSSATDACVRTIGGSDFDHLCKFASRFSLPLSNERLSRASHHASTTPRLCQFRLRLGIFQMLCSFQDVSCPRKAFYLSTICHRSRAGQII